MGNPFRHDNLSAEYKRLYTVAALASDVRTSSAACGLVLTRSGIELDPDVLDRLIGDLANVSDLHGAQPEDVQAALFRHEPVLAIEEL